MTTLRGIAIGAGCFAVHVLVVFGLLHSVGPLADIERQLGADQTEGHWHDVYDLNRWDASIYRDIVRYGYRDRDDPSRPSHRVAWFPGYPLLAGSLVAISGAKVYAVFSTLSAAFTLAFWLLLWSPAMRDRIGPVGLGCASGGIVCWPGAYYWFAGMTEALVALLLLATLRLWWTRRQNALAALLAAATAVKQVFTPLAVGVFALSLLAAPRRWKGALARLALALTGLIAYCLYGQFAFGDFRIWSTSAASQHGMHVNPLNALDPRVYWNSLEDHAGIVTVGVLAVLFAELAFVCAVQRRWRDRLAIWNPATLRSTEFALWWFAFAYTVFHVVGLADMDYVPFNSMLRYQAVDVPLYLLIGRRAAEAPRWALALFGTPLALFFLFWLRRFVFQYWLGSWVA